MSHKRSFSVTIYWVLRVPLKVEMMMTLIFSGEETEHKEQFGNLLNGTQSENSKIATPYQVKPVFYFVNKFLLALLESLLQRQNGLSRFKVLTQGLFIVFWSYSLSLWFKPNPWQDLLVTDWQYSPRKGSDWWSQCFELWNGHKVPSTLEKGLEMESRQRI